MKTPIIFVMAFAVTLSAAHAGERLNQAVQVGHDVARWGVGQAGKAVGNEFCPTCGVIGKVGAQAAFDTPAWIAPRAQAIGRDYIRPLLGH